jgi:glutamate synthase (NADPH/NADH) large chain
MLLPMTTWLLWLPKLGVLDVDPAKVITKGRLQPGKMFVVDLEQGRIISDDELKEDICTRQPYGQWLKDNKVRLQDLPEPGGSFHKYDPITFLKRQISFRLYVGRFTGNSYPNVRDR